MVRMRIELMTLLSVIRPRTDDWANGTNNALMHGLMRLNNAELFRIFLLEQDSGFCKQNFPVFYISK